MTLWAVKVFDKVYEFMASSNRQARWMGAQRYFGETNTNKTISLLYQYVKVYRVGGRKGVPF